MKTVDASRSFFVLMMGALENMAVQRQIQLEEQVCVGYGTTLNV